VVRREHLRRLLTNAKKATVSVLYWYGKLQIFQFLRKARLVFALFLVVPCPVLGGRRGRAGGRIFQLSGNRHKGAKSVASRVDATFPHEFDHFPRVERPGGRFRGFDGNCGKSDFSIRESLTKVRSSFP